MGYGPSIPQGSLSLEARSLSLSSPLPRPLVALLAQVWSWAWVVGCLVVPVLLLGGAVGEHRLPGIPDEPLFATLFAGSQVHGWLVGEGSWGWTQLAGSGAAYWPAQASSAGALAVLELVLAEPWAYAGLLLSALWLAGLGPALLARRLLGCERSAAFLVAGLAVQLSPPVLRCAWDGQLAVLAVGPLCLALACRRPWVVALCGLLAGGMGALTAVVVAFGAAIGRRSWALTALLPPLLLAVVLLLAWPSAPLPGSTTAPLDLAATPAYVTAGGASFPVTAPLSSVSEPVVPSRGASDWTSLPARIHGGPVALLGCLLGLAWRRSRSWALIGLGASTLLYLGLGPLPLPGTEAGVPSAWFAALLAWLPGGAGAPELLIPVIVAAGLGLGALVRWRRDASVFVLAVCLWTSPLLPLGATPVTNLPPLPAAEAIAAVEDGPALVLPVVGSPDVRSCAGPAELLHLAGRLDRPLPVILPIQDPALGARIAWLLDRPVRLDSAALLWKGRDEPPLGWAREHGYRALIVDSQAYTAAELGLLRAELASLAGPPLAAGPRWLVWGL